MNEEEKKIRDEILEKKEKARKEAIQKGRKLQEISSDIYLLNNHMKKLEKQIGKAILQFQNAKNKYINHKQVSMRLQFLSRALNSTLRYLNQYKINSSMINIDNVQ